MSICEEFWRHRKLAICSLPDRFFAHCSLCIFYSIYRVPIATEFSHHCYCSYSVALLFTLLHGFSKPFFAFILLSKYPKNMHSTKEAKLYIFLREN